ncbi:MAG TPA: hypothetical protein VMH86_13390 [Rhizomicrobium sp.]|nr:hypothetical protein [Rhizomicrobium sp.]
MPRESDIHRTSRARTPAGQRGEEAGVVFECCCRACRRPQADGTGDGAADVTRRFYDRDHAGEAAKLFYEKAREHFIAPAQALVKDARRALSLATSAVCAAAAGAGALALMPGLDGRFGLLPLAPAAALAGLTVLCWLALSVRRYDTMREARHQKRWIYHHELIAKAENAVEQFHSFDPDDTGSALWGLGQMAMIARVHEHLDHNLHIENIMTGVRWDNTRRAALQVAALAACGAMAAVALHLRAELHLAPAGIAIGMAVAATGLLFLLTLLLGNGLVASVRAFLEPPEDATLYRTDPFPDIARWHHHLLTLLARAQSFFQRWH